MRQGMMRDIENFHVKFGQGYNGGPRQLSNPELRFRHQVLLEETGEFGIAVDTGDKEQQLDALVDLVYFALGTAYLSGWDFDEAWRRVHGANMRKERASSENPGKRDAVKFDVVKPPGWQAPRLNDLVLIGK